MFLSSCQWMGSTEHSKPVVVQLINGVYRQQERVGFTVPSEMPHLPNMLKIVKNQGLQGKYLQLQHDFLTLC